MGTAGGSVVAAVGSTAAVAPARIDCFRDNTAAAVVGLPVGDCSTAPDPGFAENIAAGSADSGNRAPTCFGQRTVPGTGLRDWQWEQHLWVELWAENTLGLEAAAAVAAAVEQRYFRLESRQRCFRYFPCDFPRSSACRTAVRTA